MAGAPNSDTFLDDAEKVLRGKMKAKPDLVVWRGQHPHRVLKGFLDFETIIVGMSNDKNPDKPPELIILRVWLDGSAHIDLDMGSINNTYTSVPFGGGWNPLEEVEKTADRLIANI